MDHIVTTLIAALIHARYLEDAADAALQPMLRRASEALSSSSFSKRGRIMRGMVHLRPGDGYRRLVIVEAGSRGAPHGEDERGTPAFLPSATAWRWVNEHKCAVSIDVNTGRIQAYRGGAPVVLQEHGKEGSFGSQESAQRLLSREASHIYVIPLHTPGGAVDGMISIEADCRGAIGQDFVWSDCGGELSLLASVAAPYLASLPLRPVVAVEPDEFLPVIGASMGGLVKMLRVFAQQDETILIGGPTGAGKSRLARWCHEQSPRRSGRFECLDLMTVPEELQRGELFGWKKGAFTNAVKDNPGYLARAEGGTLFIDEIDKLSLSVQAGLLRVLEERCYRSLGESAGDRSADVRFIIGTNADISAAVRAGHFREDLYYRINVLPVKLPPLDDRQEEIPLWAHYMANRRHRDGGRAGQARIASAAERILTATRWPGNLRQLDNIVRRAYAIALMGHGGAPEEVVLSEQHFEQALDYEVGRAGRSVTDLLREAGVAFVHEAKRRSADGPGLDLELAESFRGFVLAAAVRLLGSREAAFRLLGREGLVANRNHHKALKRELERVEALYRAVGEEQRMPFGDLFESEEK